MGKDRIRGAHVRWFETLDGELVFFHPGEGLRIAREAGVRERDRARETVPLGK